MYVKNFDPPAKSHAHYTGLQLEGKHRWPYTIKIVTWFLVAAIVITSCVVLVFYGMSFGMIRTYLWLTTLLSSFFISLLIIAPIRIFVSSVLSAFLIKSKPVITSRKICPSLLANPDNPEKKERVLKHRQLNANLYAPTPLSKLEDRLEDIKYNIELRNMTMDLVVHICFMATLLYIVHASKPEMGYYSVEVVRNLVLRANYTNSLPFSKVTTYDTFMAYMIETLLPALLLSYADDGENDRNRTRRGVWEHGGHANLPAEVKRRQILYEFARLEGDEKKEDGFDVFKKGRTLSPTLKLLGKPRLRQVRVKTGSCKQLSHLKGRNSECAADLTPLNVERGRFTLQWEPEPPKGLTPSQSAPWAYQSASDTRTLPIRGKYTFYPGGGYVLNLGRDLKDALIALEFLHEFQWVDMRTRAVFIEFTLYCVNTNMFLVVTLIAEKTASGYIIPNYQIYTSKFMFLLLEVEIAFVFVSLIFVCFLFFFIAREGVRIHRTALSNYLKRGSVLVDLGIILLGLVSVVLVLCRSYYVSEALEKLNLSSNNEFVSFIYAAAWENWSVYAEALLICFSFFKLYYLLTFRVVFFQVQATLSHCYEHFYNLLIKQQVLIFAFAFFFSLTLANYTLEFSTFAASYSTLILQAVPFSYNFGSRVFPSFPWYLGPLFFALFVFLVIILLVNLFVAIACFNFQKIHQVPLVNKYNILEYMKHAIVSKRGSDILHLKEGKPFCDEKWDPSTMRLRGGGSKSSKGKRKTRTRRKENEKESHERVSEQEMRLKTRFSDFLTKKPYDTTEYRDLDAERVVGMKHLMLSFLPEDEETQRTERENTLKALFCSFTAGRAKSGRHNSVRGRYFFVTGKCTTAVYDAHRFVEMRKIVEDNAREKGWLIDEDIMDEINEMKDKLHALNRKLCLLLKRKNLA